MIEWKTACAAAVFLMLCGCTDLTEFDHTLQAGVNIVSTPDLSVIHTIEDISGARSLCPIPDYFIVATTEGMLFRFDLESYQQTGSFSIGTPSSAGYFEIEHSPAESSVYIIGALGQIIELHAPDMELMESFIICDAPVDIEIGIFSELPYLYVAEAISRKIFEVSLETNRTTRSCILPASPTCLAIDQNQDTLLVGTLAETELVSVVTGAMYRRTMGHLPWILAIEVIPDDTAFCAVLKYETGTIATILRYFPDYFSGTPMWEGERPIGGNIHYMCAESDGSHAYVLSYMGDNISRLVAYNCDGYFIESQIDLQGYPLDLEISSEGVLLVLTAE